MDKMLFAYFDALCLIIRISRVFSGVNGQQRDTCGTPEGQESLKEVSKESQKSLKRVSRKYLRFIFMCTKKGDKHNSESNS